MVGRGGGGGEGDEECWSFVLFLDRVASSAHPPWRLCTWIWSRRGEGEVGGPSGDLEQPGECSEGLLSRCLTRFTKSSVFHSLVFGATNLNHPTRSNLKDTPVHSCLFFRQVAITFHDVSWRPQPPPYRPPQAPQSANPSTGGPFRWIRTWLYKPLLLCLHTKVKTVPRKEIHGWHIAGRGVCTLCDVTRGWLSQTCPFVHEPKKKEEG